MHAHAHAHAHARSHSPRSTLRRRSQHSRHAALPSPSRSRLEHRTPNTEYLYIHAPNERELTGLCPSAPFPYAPAPLTTSKRHPVPPYDHSPPSPSPRCISPPRFPLPASRLYSPLDSSLLSDSTFLTLYPLP
ncbi:hypothetical protein PTI98_008382 [Pleurotus ostreatus]|nr:hypothetical protein PTI98_008382 [Pleurotus ostreatus]